MIAHIRMSGHQLATPLFETPHEIVSWMGAIQAQDYSMAKWAIGIRSRCCSLHDIDESIRKGEILRTHILRPTWHFVSSQNIRWMLQLSAKRIRSAYESFHKNLNIDSKLYYSCNRLFEKILEGKSLTRQEIAAELYKAGIPADTPYVSHFLIIAETEGIICSGTDRNGKPTYALLDERVPQTEELPKEEALAKLATLYFRSHSPASFEDFHWWSGLSVTEARTAVESIRTDLITEPFKTQNLLLHADYKEHAGNTDILHFLPAYDEYLISYKDRSAVLEKEHQAKAHNSYGIFQPVILHNGKITGNWKRSLKKGNLTIDTSFFDQNSSVNSEIIKKAQNRYKDFFLPTTIL